MPKNVNSRKIDCKIITNRRDLVKKAGVTITSGLAAGVAGCAGEGNDSSGEEADSSGENSDSSTDGEEMEGTTEFPDWDPSNPEFPQPLEVLQVDTAEMLDRNWGYGQGSTRELKNLPELKEPAYGDPPKSVPDSEGEIISPDTLLVSIMPTVDGAAYPDTFLPIAQNIESETDVTVEYQVLNSVAAMIEAMRSEQIHLGHFNGGAVPFAVNISSGRPLAMGLFGEGQGSVDPWGYRMYTVTQIDNEDINAVEDLEGKTVAHTDQNSNSGHLAPQVFIPEAGGIAPGEDYEIKFSGGHDNSLRAIPLGDYDAANIASPVVNRMVDAGEIEYSDYKVIYASKLMPTLGTPAVYRHNLDPDIVEGVKRAYLEYDYADTTIEEEMGINYFIEFPDYATVADVFLKIHKQTGRNYDIDDI